MPTAALPPTRNIAVDAYRGFVMLLMMAEVLRLDRLAAAFPGSAIAGVLAYHQTHVDWAGCSLHDLIQPSFSFLVGVALPYSVARRQAEGGTAGRLFGHALWRSLVLVALGIFLRSTHSAQTNFTFEDTLTQIGLGYPFLFLLAFRSVRAQWTALALILAGYWLAWALYPVAGPGYDYQAVGVPPDWPHHYSGLAAHWNKNNNLGHEFDVWFLNLFPREKPFLYNGGGWSTLSFIPTLATMMLGLWAGRWLMTSRSTTEKLKGLVIGGVALTLAGLILQWLHINPIIKRIWTSSYTLYSGGLVVLLLAGFYAVIELKGWKRWVFPLLVIGANSIAVYVMSWTMESFVSSALVRHLGTGPFLVFGPPFEPVLRGFGVLLVFWLILYWMYRRKIFLRI